MALENSLTEQSRRAAQPVHIRTPLLPHQLASIEAMRYKEISFQHGYPITNTGETLYSSYAQYSDRSGVGKTLATLGHISNMATFPLTNEASAPTPSLTQESSPALFSIIQRNNIDNLFDTLIVVPFAIYRQWQDVITNETNLQANFLKTNRDLEKDNLLQNLRSSHLTLISNTLLAPFMNSLNGYNNPRWRRVFYDEADTIKISSTCAHPAANMTWYISSHYTHLMLADSHISSYAFRQLSPAYIAGLSPEVRALVDYHIDNHPSIIFFKTTSAQFFSNHLKTKHPLRAHLVVRSSDEFIDASIRVPPVTEEVVRCLAPVSHQLIEYTIPNEVREMLNAGDVKGALQRLGVSQHTPLTLVGAVKEYKEKEIEQLRRNPTPRSEEKIAAIMLQVQGIQQRLEQVSEDVCAICFESPSAPVLTPCCSKMFCGDCMLKWMMRTLACPLCREEILPKDLKSIGDISIIQTQPILPRKIHALLKILQDNPNGKFLVFSRFDNPLLEIHETIAEHYPSQNLGGNKDIIARQIAEFETGITKVLLLNSSLSIAGMNLPSATHVILYHKMGMDEERNILSRAQRIGRKTSLHFTKLLYERE